jgi:hypothetical protein
VTRPACGRPVLTGHSLRRLRALSARLAPEHELTFSPVEASALGSLRAQRQVTSSQL